MKTKLRGIVACIEVCQKRAKWYWRMVAHNGEVLDCAQQYSSKTKAMQTASKIAKQLGVGVR